MQFFAAIPLIIYEVCAGNFDHILPSQINMQDQTKSAEDWMVLRWIGVNLLVTWRLEKKLS